MLYLKCDHFYPMKIKSLTIGICAVVAALILTSPANAHWGSSPGWGSAPGWYGSGPGGTGPGWGAWGPGYGGVGYWYHNSPMSPYLGRVQIRGDVDYSNQIDFADAALGNEAKRNPNGLIIASDEMTKLLLTCQPNADRQRAQCHAPDGRQH